MMPRVVPLLVLAVIGASCGFKSEPIGSLPDFPQAADDALGRTVVVDEAPERLVSLDPGMTEAAYEIGADRLLVGGAGTETYPPRAAKLRPMLTEDGMPDLPRIRKARADLVLVPSSLAPSVDEANAIARKLGTSVYVTDHSSVDAIEHDILELGLLTGHASQARAVYAGMRQQIEAITSGYGDSPPVPVFVDKGYFYTVGPAGLAADLIRLAGGSNVAEEADVSAPFRPKLLREAAPEVYLAIQGTGVTLQGLKRSPGTRDLPAVRDRRFALVPADVFEQGGPRVVESLETLARAIHPEAASPGS